ncbi:8987_t:CDS:2 [Dentiscutata erythropus]|uniref:8987_t:CDS:1 n=1 Tax=Dentiscutata erythropus TaxID=1348616 RepID=A0A9N8VUS4_9GLOM|nr:8987_t:CDS:2 [Dentiscutata erythropus]
MLEESKYWEENIRKRNGRKIKGYAIENIRKERFHNVESSKYPFPNDKRECDRLLLQHLMWKNSWNGNFSAPVKNILANKESKVLDVGCGPGIWTLDMATNFPEAHFAGVDFAPIQPNENNPENVTFIQANALEGLPFEDNTFDYVFQRFLIIGYPKDKWAFIINELVRVLKPGGYLEMMEDDFEPGNMGFMTNKLVTPMLEDLESNGLDTKICYKLQKNLEQNKMLKNIWSEQRIADSSSTDIGNMHVTNCMEQFQVLKVKISKLLNVTANEFDKILDTIYEEFIEFNSFTLTKRAYAQKVEKILAC